LSGIRRVLSSLLEEPIRELERTVPAFKRRRQLKAQAQDGLQTIRELVRDAKAGESASDPPDPAVVDDAASEADDVYGLTLVRAMIAAARSDGRFDAAEKKVIYSAVREHGLSKDDQALLQAELKQPIDLDAVVQDARSLRVADEVYIAALLAIVVDTPEERAWLEQLAQALRLDPRLVARIHQDLGIAS